MKTRFLFSLLVTGFTGYCVTHTITNSGFSFSPASLTIPSGDDVMFSLESIHDAVEVSQAVWNANSTTANGGFTTGVGGGLVPASKLTVGMHWYVCTFHVDSNQMK